MSARSALSAIAAISGLCDAFAGAFLLFGARYLAPDLPFLQATPAVFRDLNALFLIAVGAGFYWPWRDPHAFRGYMWVMGVALKAAGAAVLVLYYLAGSPSAFLLFAATDAVLAIATLGALHITRGAGQSGG